MDLGYVTGEPRLLLHSWGMSRSFGVLRQSRVRESYANFWEFQRHFTGDKLGPGICLSECLTRLNSALKSQRGSRTKVGRTGRVWWMFSHLSAYLHCILPSILAHGLARAPYGASLSHLWLPPQLPSAQ